LSAAVPETFFQDDALVGLFGTARLTVGRWVSVLTFTEPALSGLPTPPASCTVTVTGNVPALA
jgi:hypothetical protein